MLTKKRTIVMVLSVFILILAACAPAADNLPETGDDQQPPATQAPGDALPEAVLLAQSWLAEQFGVPVDRVQIVDTEQVEWQDSCLGLGGPAESCLQAITPGYRVTLDVDGTLYEVHTDATGVNIRMVEAAPQGEVQGDNPLADTSWTLVSMGPEGAETPAVEGPQVTLVFEDQKQAVGTSGCNSYGGNYLVDGDSISFESVVSTLMACEDAGIMEQEQSFLEALETASRFELTEAGLSIWYGDGQNVLNFAAG